MSQCKHQSGEGHECWRSAASLGEFAWFLCETLEISFSLQPNWAFVGTLEEVKSKELELFSPLQSCAPVFWGGIFFLFFGSLSVSVKGAVCIWFVVRVSVGAWAAVHLFACHAPACAWCPGLSEAGTGLPYPSGPSRWQGWVTTSPLFSRWPSVSPREQGIIVTAKFLVWRHHSSVPDFKGHYCITVFWVLLASESLYLWRQTVSICLL